MSQSFINYTNTLIPKNLESLIEESTRADLVEADIHYLEHPREWVTTFQTRIPNDEHVQFFIATSLLVPVGRYAFQVVILHVTQTYCLDLFEAMRRNINYYLSGGSNE